MRSTDRPRAERLPGVLDRRLRRSLIDTRSTCPFSREAGVGVLHAARASGSKPPAAPNASAADPQFRRLGVRGPSRASVARLAHPPARAASSVRPRRRIATSFTSPPLTPVCGFGATSSTGRSGPDRGRVPSEEPRATPRARRTAPLFRRVPRRVEVDHTDWSATIISRPVQREAVERDLDSSSWRR